MSKRRNKKNTASGAWRLAIVPAAILLPVLLTSCDKKGQEGEKKSVQKSEDDFLDKDAKPEERKYMLAAKPFFIALSNSLRLLSKILILSKTNRMHSTT